MVFGTILPHKQGTAKVGSKSVVCLVPYGPNEGAYELS